MNRGIQTYPWHLCNSPFLHILCTLNPPSSSTSQQHITPLDAADVSPLRRDIWGDWCRSAGMSGNSVMVPKKRMWKLWDRNSVDVGRKYQHICLGFFFFKGHSYESSGGQLTGASVNNLQLVCKPSSSSNLSVSVKDKMTSSWGPRWPSVHKNIKEKITLL